MLRFDHVGVVVEDLEAVAAFFASLGFEREGGTLVEGDVVDAINGLDGVRAQIEMVRTPDRTGRLELVKYLAPADDHGPDALPPNRAGFRHICVEVDDLDATVGDLRGKGLDTVGEVRDYGTSYRLCYLRGPEGLIVEFAQKLDARAAAS